MDSFIHPEFLSFFICIMHAKAHWIGFFLFFAVVSVSNLLLFMNEMLKWKEFKLFVYKLGYFRHKLL